MRALQAGFTLIEAVMVITLTAVIFGVVSVFIAPATTAYFATTARAQLSDQADTALRRIARDLARALPNSARVSSSGLSVELIPVTSAARYAIESGDPLQFGSSDTGFDIVGPGLKLATASQKLAFYNLGAGVPDADAYQGANVRTATTGAGVASHVDFAGGGLATSLMAPPYRVYAIEPPVSYRCDLAAGTLTRHANYGFNASQAEPPAGGSSAILARQVSACAFSYDPAAVGGRNGVVALQLTLTSQGESVALYQAVHVDNLP